ncbi:serine O-acetyltransferase [Pyruvatibacter mobilis]|uniref:serine O-acetyltransferase n=1 Tax=Pyruvatibacter mobilis TaxID=1712261 RepID=UPI003BA8D349
MSQPIETAGASLAQVDPVWDRIRREAEDWARSEPLLASYLHAAILNHRSFESSLSYHLAEKLANDQVGAMLLQQVFDDAYDHTPEIAETVRADIVAVFDRDPACDFFLQPLLYFKGFQAIEGYRVAHWCWTQGRVAMAYHLQSRISEVFGVDIHPNAKIGRGVMMDHATSVVIGETAVVGDDVSMLHSVTLGGTGKEDGDRHPKIGRGVMLGAGAKVLGNITVGNCARVAAGSVVTKAVPANTTVAGVPAKVIGEAGCPEPARSMDQMVGGCDDEGAAI